MARPKSKKPWPHKPSGYWCATFSGKRHYLDRDYKLACRKLVQLRAKEKREDAGGFEWLDAPFIKLVDTCMLHLEATRKPNTYRANRYRLLRAQKIMGTDLRVGEVGKIHLAKIKQHMAGKYSPTSIADTITAMQAVFNFACKHDLLEVNSLRGYEKPARRSRIITPAERQLLLKHSDVNFRRVLLAAFLTGCRPVELRTLIWEWVDLEAGFWTFPDHKTVTTQRQPRPRIIPLPDPIWKLSRWLAKNQTVEHVFLNQNGKPYTKDCLVTKTGL